MFGSFSSFYQQFSEQFYVKYFMLWQSLTQAQRVFVKYDKGVDIVFMYIHLQCSLCVGELVSTKI